MALLPLITSKNTLGNTYEVKNHMKTIMKPTKEYQKHEFFLRIFIFQPSVGPGFLRARRNRRSLTAAKPKPRDE